MRVSNMEDTFHRYSIIFPFQFIRDSFDDLWKLSISDIRRYTQNRCSRRIINAQFSILRFTLTISLYTTLGNLYIVECDVQNMISNCTLYYYNREPFDHDHDFSISITEFAFD